MNFRRNLPYWLLVGGTACWVAAVVAAPFARAHGWGWGEWTYLAFHPVCHQMPERSFSLLGEPFAVCHRCFGLYSGFLFGLLAFPSLGRWRAFLLEHPRWVVAPALPMLVDVALGSWNRTWDRFGTGLLASFPIALLAWVAAEQLYQRYRAGRKENYELR
ncbi:MAG TPA: DUF2085 domain-containing protein [Thermoanaerobaculia bacterium]|nr:DUF2085 domain-containing protein [Thermoanaerobaculia bacterium]